MTYLSMKFKMNNTDNVGSIHMSIFNINHLSCEAERQLPLSMLELIPFSIYLALPGMSL